MIKLERTSVMNIENAIRGMRNPLGSWDKADSELRIMNPDDVEFGYEPNYEYIIGENDLALAKKLCAAGSDHRKFMRQIFVSVDITAPLYWWKEYDTYKVGTAANSCSTMHTLHKQELTEGNFSFERVDRSDIFAVRTIENLLFTLNHLREKYAETGEVSYWEGLIQLLPSSFNQMRTCTLNYENLMNIYHARKNHKLAEWREFCGWIEGLPYARELICGGEEV